MNTQLVIVDFRIKIKSYFLMFLELFLSRRQIVFLLVVWSVAQKEEENGQQYQDNGAQHPQNDSQVENWRFLVISIFFIPWRLYCQMCSPMRQEIALGEDCTDILTRVQCSRRHETEAVFVISIRQELFTHYNPVTREQLLSKIINQN